MLAGGPAGHGLRWRGWRWRWLCRARRAAACSRHAAQPWTVRFEPRAGGANSTETVTLLSASREIRSDTGRNTVSVDLQLDSEILRGRVLAKTSLPFMSWIGAIPDQGTLLLTGAPGPVTALTLDPAGTVTAQLGAASAGNAVYADLSTDFLWSGAGWLPPEAAARQYTLGTAAAVGLRLWAAPAAAYIPPDGVLEFWFSRPVEQTGTADNVFELTRDYRWGASKIPAELRIEGGLVTVRPGAQLTPVSQYGLLLPALSSSAMRQGDTVAAAVGQVGQIGSQGPADRWTVTTPLTAALAVRAPGLLLGSDALTLDASGSRTSDGAAPASYRWSQVSGPTLAFSSTGSALTSVSAGSAMSGGPAM